MRKKSISIGRFHVSPTLVAILFWLIILLGIPLFIVLLAGPRHH